MIGVDLVVENGNVEDITVWETDDARGGSVSMTAFSRTGESGLLLYFSEEGLRFLIDELQRKLR